MQTKLMFKYLKKLPGKGFLPIIVLIWGLGVGLRLISITTCIILTAVIVAVWLIYALIKWVQSKKKGEEEPELEEIAGFEDRLVKVVRSAKDASWYLLIGPVGCGKTSLLGESDLDFPYIDSLRSIPAGQGIEETQNCDFFCTKEAVILDTTGRYVTFGNEAREQAEWYGFLSLLKKHRKKKPIDGLIVAVDVARLLEDEQHTIEREAKTIRDRITEAISRLGITLPVYLVFTKCDRIYGFSQFFANLTTAERAQVWGATLREAQQERAELAFKDECQQLLLSLKAHRLPRLASAETQETIAVYTFPSEFDASYQKLAYFVATLLPSISEEKPMFRGFYLTSSVQDANPSIDLVMRRISESFGSQLTSPAEQSPGGKDGAKGYFIKNLFQRVIFQDRGLYRPTTLADRRQRLMRILFCAVVVVVFAALSVMFTVSYFQNKRLMTDAGQRAYSVSQVGERTTAEERAVRAEELRTRIVRLERFRLFSLPWNRERDEVAANARRAYLEKILPESRDKWPHKFTREVEIPVKVYINPDDGEPRPIEKTPIRVFMNNKEYNLQTDKEGSDTFKARVEHAKADVLFIIDHEEPEYEVLEEQIYTIQPGETVSKEIVWFTFSKLGRTIITTCVDQNGKPLAGVPVSAIEQNEEKTDHGPEMSNEQGVAQIKLNVPDGTVLHIYYGESGTSFPVDGYDVVTIQSGRSKYPVNRQVPRKIQVSVVVVNPPKSEVSISVGGIALPPIKDGQWTGPSSVVPTDDNVEVKPRPVRKDITQTNEGYSISLRYREISPVPLPSSDERYLQAVGESNEPIKDVEVWLYVKAESAELFDEADEEDQMEFESDGERVRFVLISSTDKRGRLEIPKDATGHQLLLCHLDYWPQQANWRNKDQQVQMVSIKQEREHLGKTYEDGASKYHTDADRAHRRSEWGKALLSYQKALKLMPTKLRYYKLAWAYNDSGRYSNDAVWRCLERGKSLQVPESDDEKGLREALEDELKRRGFLFHTGSIKNPSGP